MTELIIQTGKHAGKKIDLAGQDCIIGRHESCKIRVASGEVSKQHCRLKHKPGGVHAKDLGSRNGTFVNQERITAEVLLKPGDTLQVGPMTFLVAEGKTKPAAKAGGKVKSATPSEPKAAKAADDDLIASWLSEGGDDENSGPDTTVIISSAVQNALKESSESSSSSADDPLKSVRDRAQNIIRRYLKENGKG